MPNIIDVIFLHRRLKKELNDADGQKITLLVPILFSLTLILGGTVIAAFPQLLTEETDTMKQHNILIPAYGCIFVGCLSFLYLMIMKSKDRRVK